MRKKLIAGNWKMHLNAAEAANLVNGIIPAAQEAAASGNADVLVAPTFTLLWAARQAIGTAPIELSAQNLFWEEKGAFTGEISPLMLVDAGCKRVIVGHSERRQYFGETDETVSKRLKAALGAGLKAILCIGETLSEREAEDTEKILALQLAGGLAEFTPEMMDMIVIAYEPVWAIGTGKTATKEQAQEAHAFIRQTLNETFGADVANKTRILYGGSVKPDNAAELMAQPDVDGALVGGASLKPGDFNAIIRASL